MIDDLDGLDLATGEFGRFLDGVSAAHLGLSTPCPKWDVRYLVAHAVGGNRFAGSQRRSVLGGRRTDHVDLAAQ